MLIVISNKIPTFPIIHSMAPCWSPYHTLQYADKHVTTLINSHVMVHKAVWRGLTDFITLVVLSCHPWWGSHFFNTFLFSFTRSFYFPYVLEGVCIIAAFITWQATGNSWAGFLNEILSMRGWKAVNLVNVIKMKHSLFSKVKLIICVEVSLRDKWHFRLWFVTG